MTHVLDFKKAAALSLAAALSFTVVACSDDSTDSTQSQSENSQSLDPTDTHLYKYDNKGEGWKHNEGAPDSPYSNNPKYIEEYANLDIYKDGSETAEGNRPETPKKTEADGPFTTIDVYSGDTLTIDMDGENKTIRLLGIEAPTSTKEAKYAEKSKESLEDMLQNSDGEFLNNVYLIADPKSPDTDEYGNLLRYAYVFSEIHPSFKDSEIDEVELFRRYHLTNNLSYSQLQQGNGRFYMEPDQEPLKYASLLYWGEEQGAQYHKGIWNKERKEALND